MVERMNLTPLPSHPCCITQQVYVIFTSRVGGYLVDPQQLRSLPVILGTLGYSVQRHIVEVQVTYLVCSILACSDDYPAEGCTRWIKYYVAN